MADKKENTGVGKPVSKLMDFVQSNLNKLYKSTYYSQPDNRLDFDALKSNIDTSIDNIVNNNKEKTGMANISRLYSRMNTGKNTSNEVVDEIEDLFNDKSLIDGLMMSAYNDNKLLKEFDNEIDLICKYMPQLEDALDAKKDNVLAADHFSKDFINATNTSKISDNTFDDRLKQMKEKYNLLELFENLYDNTAHYGEQFVYIVSYQKALSRLLQNRSNLKSVNMEAGIIEESVMNECFEDVIVKEEFLFNEAKTESGNKSINTEPLSDLNLPEKISIEYNRSGILEKAIKEHNKAKTVITKQQKGKLINDELSFEGLEGQESIINTDSTSKEKVNIKVPGCVVRVLPRENVIPLYIDNLCLGYYYIEHDSDEFFSANATGSDPITSFKSKNMFNNNNMARDNMLKYLSTQLSKNIDSKFVNANQDLSKEIYMILKGNDMLNASTAQIKISFIEADDMVHMYFNKDPKSNRGISDLQNALIPAKLYVSLYVTNTVGYLTRGFDKRVYYVKQNVDTNIAQTLLNTISQIKKSNFGSREMTNLKTILNMTGRYNDYVIPLSSTGDSPIQFEVMQGQNIEVKTDLMNQLEQMAISSTDVPYEYIQSRQTVDYAVRLTMSSGKFLRKAFKRQVQVERPFSLIMTKIHNYEYEENDEIEVNLPPPAYLNLINTNQMIQNANDYTQNLVDSECADEDDAFKARFAKKIKRDYLSTYINYSKVDKIKEQTRMELKAEKEKGEETA